MIDFVYVGIVVGCGGAGGGRSPIPPFGSKRRKSGQIVSLFGHTSGEKLTTFTCNRFKS